MKSRDSIASAIKSFASLLSTKLLVKQYVQHATAAYHKAQGESGGQSRQQSPAGSRRSSVTPQGGGNNRNTLGSSGSGGGQGGTGRRMTKTNVPSFAFSKPGTAGRYFFRIYNHAQILVIIILFSVSFNTVRINPAFHRPHLSSRLHKISFLSRRNHWL